MTASDASSNSPRNRLAQCSSPYLRQHADNPVDWWPWCAQALEHARALDRPILLSIGYSACHWCHVMAHESFEDAATAELMNAHYVNIKVDREERPDLDKIYQTAHQLLTQRPGGWPLTVFLTPDDLTPFFAGTYFPPKPRHGMPGFGDVLQRIAQVYHAQHDVIRSQNQSLLEALNQLAPDARAVVPAVEVAELMRDQLASRFDPEHGGFGGAPKFPHTSELVWLLRRYATSLNAYAPDAQSLRMARVSLEHMARGGLMDQIGGGFFRYAVDAQWMIPHFEKMLYDNGPLLGLCCDMYAATGVDIFASAAHGIADWTLREMQSPQGGYFASLDADSEGAEGRFYVWSDEELHAVLDADVWATFAELYGLHGTPNFEGSWHLRSVTTPAAIAERRALDPERVDRQLTEARKCLLARRAARERPGRDEKILPAWNALMISGMARAARVLGRGDCLASAERALDFLRTHMWHDGRLCAACTDGHAHLDAYLDDYANLLDALLELLQVRWSNADLAWATELADALLGQFQDEQAGGFWFTSNTHEALPARLKPLADESLPAGNGVAALALQRLGYLLSEPRYLAAAEGTLKVAATALERYPGAHATLLMALEEHHAPPELLVIRATAGQLPGVLAEARQGYQPWRLAFGIADDTADLPAALAAKRPGAGPRLYRCVGTHCAPPVETVADLVRQPDGR